MRRGLGRAGVSVLTLNRLPPRETAAIALRLAATAIPQALIDRLVARSDGVPLFIEELTRAVLESGLRMDALPRRWCRTRLQASLLSRLDRLPAAKAAAQIGSVIGRSFSHDLAAAIADMPADMLEEGLRATGGRGSRVAPRRGVGAEPIQFKHALVQDTAYQSMLRPRRAALHAAIVAIAGTRCRRRRDDPALIAHHCAEAGLIAQAVRYFLRGGRADRGARRDVGGAHATHPRPETGEENPGHSGCAGLAHAVHLALGEVLGALRFYVSPETGAALAEAVKLARIMAPDNKQRDPLLARSLFGYYVHQLYRGDFRSVRLLSDELLALGRQRGNPGIATLGAIANGICRVYQGEIVAARRDLPRYA